MPYKSDKQRKFMHAQHPEIAKRWDEEYGPAVARKKALENHIQKKKKQP